jgi:hypothetical protein
MSEGTPARSGSKIAVAAAALGLAVGGYAVASGAGGSSGTPSTPTTLPHYDAAASDATPDGSYDRAGHDGKCRKDGAGSSGSSGQSAPSTETPQSDATAEI